MSIVELALTYSDPTLKEAATKLAAALNLPVFDAMDTNSLAPFTYLMTLTPTYLGIQARRDQKTTPFYIDFHSGKMQYRSKHAGLRSEMLARAIGKHPRDNPSILDATAGLGRDSFILASLGFTVTMLERSPILHALLSDALRRASDDPVLKQLSLHQADAITWMQNKSFDVIYLDPMFPERQKSASIKKDLAILQDLLGKDTDCEDLFNLAQTCATQRVVVKRPRLACTITERAPSFSLTGKSSRFDIYLTPKR